MANFIFQEKQRFRQIWLWTILLGVGVIVIVAIVLELKNGDSVWEGLIPIGIIALVFVLIARMELTTRIDEHSLSFKFFPFIRERKYSFDRLTSMELIEYNGLLEYGGWGIKWNVGSWSYTIGGRFGILVKTGSKKFLIGTQIPEEAKKAIKQFNEFKAQSYGS